jgi:hypothetical protein
MDVGRPELIQLAEKSPTRTTGVPVVPVKRGFYEKVTDVNISSLFFLRWGLCFSLQLRRMLFSTLFLYALCMGLRLSAGWGPMEKSMLPVFGRPR